jgi:hypothetical protein
MDESSNKQGSLLWAIGVILVIIGTGIIFIFPSFYKDHPLFLLILLFIINFLLISLILKRIKTGEIYKSYSETIISKPPIIRATNPGDFWFHIIISIGAEIIFFTLFLILLIFYLLTIFS